MDGTTKFPIDFPLRETLWLKFPGHVHAHSQMSGERFYKKGFARFGGFGQAEHLRELISYDQNYRYGPVFILDPVVVLI